MYQNCCSKCGSVDLYTEVKGTNTGLYCSDCGAYQKWLGKDELRAFENAITKQKDNRWITASERLPEDGILVLIKTIVENNLEPTVGSWNETLGTWKIGNDAIMWDFLNDSLVNEVIAWMPLPKPWKESVEEWRVEE